MNINASQSGRKTPQREATEETFNFGHRGSEDPGPAPVSLLVRIVNLVLLDGRIHITHKSGFVWTMDKKF